MRGSQFLRVFRVRGSLAVCLVLLITLVPAVDEAVCQTNQLPRANFQAYGKSYRYGRSQSTGVSGRRGSLRGAGAVGRGSTGAVGPTISSDDYRLSTPGMHLTRGENRTRQNFADPYNPGEPTLRMALVRWRRGSMPLKIWISPGLELPKIPFKDLQGKRVMQVFNIVRKRQLQQLPVAKGWTPDTNYQVAAGIEQWRGFQDEGLISFGFTNDPNDANVFIFFTDMFKGTSGPGGINVGGNTSCRVYKPQDFNDPRYFPTPVVIELSTQINHLPEKMQGAAAHEFGHALGIKAHSPYRQDIMYSDRVVNTLSEGDKSTLRLLYKSKPQYYIQ